MNPSITEGLSNEQLQQFDIDSIKELIKKYKETKELINFDLDGNESLSLEEIEIFNQLEKTGNILDGLNQIIKEIEKRKIEKKETSIFENIFGDKETISSKNIDDYSKEEAKKVLEYLNINYKNYSDSISSSLDSITENISSTDSLENIDTKTEVNIFQKKLINKIIGNNKGYSGEYLQGYNNEKGDFIIDTGEVISNLKKIDIKNLNSIILVNLFKYLRDNHKINILELKSIFGKKQLTKLKEFWNSDKSNNIAKNYLLENNLGYIIDIMDKDLDYYSSLSPKELKQKLKEEFKGNEQSIEYRKKLAQINIEIVLKKINENKNILISLGFKQKELDKIENNYNQKLKNKSNKNLDIVFDNLNKINEYNETLQYRIESILEKKIGIDKNDILGKYGIENFTNDENDEEYNIKTDELLNKLINISDINKIVLIISELKFGDIIDNSFNTKDNKLIDLYINKITKEGTISQKTELIKNLSLFRSQNLCPSSNVVIELKKSIIINNKMTNYIKNQIDNMYPYGDNLGEELINSIKEKMDNSKEGKKYCTIDIAKIIIEFDKKHLNAKKDGKPITENEIKKLIEGTLQLEKEQINNKISVILEKAGLIGGGIMSAYELSKKELNLKSLNIGNNSNDFTFIANLTLRELTIEQINNLQNITPEEKEILLKAKKDLKQVDIAQKNIYSFSDKEFAQIIQGIKDGKKTEDIKKEIEKNRNNDISNYSNENNKITEETFSKTNNGYNIIGKNGKPIEGLIISEEEKNLITKNPETKENIINFYTTLKELGLGNLWQYRNEISNSIGSTNGVNNNDNSLTSNELQIFLNNILVSVGKEKIKPQSDINQFKNLFKNQNDYQVVGEGFKNDSNKIGNSNIEEIFMKKYVIGFPKFQSTIFSKDIQKKS